MIDFPDPLFETDVEGDHLCLVCGSAQARRALWTVHRLVVPLCEDCRADWNCYGYLIFRKITPTRLLSSIVKYKLLHPFRAPSWRGIWRDLRGFQEWARQMKPYM